MEGITFGTKHSYYDWNLILTNVEIDEPEAKTCYIDIPGADGSIDLTEALTGDVKYESRSLKFSFIIKHKTEYEWSAVYSNIGNYIHGKKLKIVLDSDPSFYYMGRCSLSWESDKRLSTIVISAECEPYKMEIFSSLEDWHWDPFNFENGIIRDYKDLIVDETLIVNIEGRRKSVIPSFNVNTEDESGLQVEFDGIKYDLPEGISRILNINLKEGTNRLVFFGKGTVSIEYRGGSL